MRAIQTIAEKKLSLLDGVVLAITMVIGSGLFALPGLVVASTDPYTALLGWGLVILLVAPLIGVFAKLGQMFPHKSGLSHYGKIGLGQWAGHGITLVSCGTLLVGMPAFFMVGGAYVAKLLAQDSEPYAPYYALCLVVITGLTTLIGSQWLARLNRILVMMIPLILLVIMIKHFALSLDWLSTWKTVMREGETGKGGYNFQLNRLWLAASLIFWAFQGWENLTFTTVTIANPKRNLPWVYYGSFIIVSLFYLSLATSVSAASTTHPMNGLASLADLLPQGMVGQALLVSITMILLANANAWVFGAAHGFNHAVRDGVLFSWLGSPQSDPSILPPRIIIFCSLAYSLVLAIMLIAHISPTLMFQLTTQGFIFLYGGALAAYARLTKGWHERLLLLLAILGWGFLLQGFGWTILYPFALLILGTIIQHRPNKRRENHDRTIP